MKKCFKFLAPTLVLLMIAAFGVGQANAFKGRGGKMDRGQRLERLAKELGLSDQQKQQIKTVFQENRTKMEPMIKQMRTERQALGKLIHSDSVDESAIRAQSAKIAAIQADLAVNRAQMFQKMRTVLTPEQVEKLKSIQEKRQAKMGNWRHCSGPCDPAMCSQTK